MTIFSGEIMNGGVWVHVFP